MTEDSAFKYLKRTGSIFVKASIIVNNSQMRIVVERYHSFGNARTAVRSWLNSGWCATYINKTQAERMGWYD